MKNEVEKEYKILVTSRQFQKLCERYPNLYFIRQINTYYDTLQHDIQNMQGAMRIREKEDSYIFTLKMHTDKGLMEHECCVTSRDPDEVFQTYEIRKLLQSYEIEGPFVETAVCITDRAVVESDEAELCFDRNQFYNGITDYEIEYEYKKEHDGFSVFNEILKPLNIQYTSNCESKIARALHAKKS